MKVKIRPARKKDYDEIRRITSAAYVGAGYFPPDDQGYLPKLLDIDSRARKALLWVAEVDGDIKGAVTVAEADSPYAEIAARDELEFRMLAVDPAAQRGGIGRAMVQAVIDHARGTDGIRAVSLSSDETMTGAHRLYESLGFVRAPGRDWTVPGPEIRLLVYRLAL